MSMRSPVIVAGRGIDRDKGNDLAVDLYIDLINTVAQILIVMRRDTVIFQQTLFKPGYVPRGVIAAVGIRSPAERIMASTGSTGSLLQVISTSAHPASSSSSRASSVSSF